MLSILQGYERYKRFVHSMTVQIVFNVHNPVKLKILTVNLYNQILNLFYAHFVT